MLSLSGSTVSARIAPVSEFPYATAATPDFHGYTTRLAPVGVRGRGRRGHGPPRPRRTHDRQGPTTSRSGLVLVDSGPGSPLGAECGTELGGGPGPWQSRVHDPDWRPGPSDLREDRRDAKATVYRHAYPIQPRGTRSNSSTGKGLSQHLPNRDRQSAQAHVFIDRRPVFPVCGPTEEVVGRGGARKPGNPIPGR